MSRFAARRERAVSLVARVSRVPPRASWTMAPRARVAQRTSRATVATTELRQIRTVAPSRERSSAAISRARVCMPRRSLNRTGGISGPRGFRAGVPANITAESKPAAARAPARRTTCSRIAGFVASSLQTSVVTRRSWRGYPAPCLPVVAWLADPPPGESNGELCSRPHRTGRIVDHRAPTVAAQAGPATGPACFGSGNLSARFRRERFLGRSSQHG